MHVIFMTLFYIHIARMYYSTAYNIPVRVLVSFHYGRHACAACTACMLTCIVHAVFNVLYMYMTCSFGLSTYLLITVIHILIIHL